MKFQLKILAGSLIAMVAVNAAAGRGGAGNNGNMPSFSDFDLDGNGVMTEQEFNEGHALRMAKLAEEGRQMKNVANAPGFAGIDSNSDGEISKEEFAAHQVECMQKNKRQGANK